MGNAHPHLQKVICEAQNISNIEIPSEMEVAPRYTLLGLFTLFTLLTLFKLFTVLPLLTLFTLVMLFILLGQIRPTAGKA